MLMSSEERAGVTVSQVTVSTNDPLSTLYEVAVVMTGVETKKSIHIITDFDQDY